MAKSLLLDRISEDTYRVSDIKYSYVPAPFSGAQMSFIFAPDDTREGFCAVDFSQGANGNRSNDSFPGDVEEFKNLREGYTPVMFDERDYRLWYMRRSLFVGRSWD